MSNGSVGLTDVIQAPVERIVDVLTDFDAYPEWQGAVLECEVLERDAEGRGSLVRMKVDAKVRKIEYIVRYEYDLPATLMWNQQSGDLAKNTGGYTFTERADGSSEVTVDIVAEPAFFMPGPMKRLIRDQALKNSMRELKKRVEG